MRYVVAKLEHVHHVLLRLGKARQTRLKSFVIDERSIPSISPWFSNVFNFIGSSLAPAAFVFSCADTSAVQGQIPARPAHRVM